jgi:integrase
MKRPDEAGALLVKLKYIRKEKDGRIYVRRPGFPSVRLRQPPGTEAFYLEYARALGATEAPAPKIKTAAPETLAWLCNQHFASGTFRDALKKSTQSVRRRALLDVCRRHGGKRFRLMEERHVRRIMEEKAASPEVANTILKSLRALFKWAIDMGHATRNPTRDVPKRKYKTEGFHTWTEAEIAQYRASWPSGTTQRLAFELLLCTGCRRQDAVRLGRQMVQKGWLRFTRKKPARSSRSQCYRSYRRRSSARRRA